MAVSIYARVSTEEQRERQSIRTQLDFAERYCQLHSMGIFKVYSDDGISGTVPLENRPEGSQILRDARAGKFDQILVYRLDRLGRETRLILNAVAELEKLGVRLKSMTEEFDTGTATGRLLLTMLSGFATHERDVIRERSVAGTFRVAEAGAWLGGIVPFGYRKVGEKRDAKLVISEDPIPGVVMSEAEVIREVFRMAAVERKSCFAIAAYLNQLKIPCAYSRDDRLVLRGKRKQKTSGLWRPGRIRGLITNKTYMGVHEYGKRSSTGRSVVSRPVPAIITEEAWKKAQQTLSANFLFSNRNARNQYLLRGLIKCALCGLTYVGVASSRPNGKREFYYRCNGQCGYRGLYGNQGQKCPSKAVRGEYLEGFVWTDVESFLRDPGALLQELQAKLEKDSAASENQRARVRVLEELLADKATERDRVVGLYRRGRLSDDELDRQMAEISQEESALDAQLQELNRRLDGAVSIRTNLDSAGTLLARLRSRLDRPVTWELKRQLVEVLVSGLVVETVEEHGVVIPRVTVTYRFEKLNTMDRVIAAEEHLRSPIHIPIQPRTIGDHLRLRRLQLKLLQKDVAARLGVTISTIVNWETNGSEPYFSYIPRIIEFLGYDPLPPGQNWAERLVRGRKVLGITQAELAHRLDVDQSTLARWERGEREPTEKYAQRAERVITEAEVEAKSTEVRQVG